MAQQVFWERKTLNEMTASEWESLCDGCALCCLQKVEDDETLEVHYTSVVCHLLDKANCYCTEYQNRVALVPNCVKLRPQDVEEFHWLPPSCSYRLIYEGKSLPDWHPLVTGQQDSVIKANASVLSIYEVTDKDITDEQLIDYVLL